MIKKVISYEDFDGNKRTEEFWFHLTKTEVAELEVSVDGGITKMIERLIQLKDTKRIIEIMKDVIQKSYGVKSPDGRRFIKNKEVLEEFTQTEAYSILFMELATDAEKAVEFFAGVIPGADTPEIKAAAMKRIQEEI